MASPDAETWLSPGLSNSATFPHTRSPSEGAGKEEFMKNLDAMLENWKSEKWPTFDLEGFESAVPVSFARDMPGQFSKEVLLKWKPFAEWIETLKASLKLQYRDTKPLHPFHDDPYVLRKIHIQAVDYFGPRPGFIKLDAVLQSANKGKPLTLRERYSCEGGVLQCS